MPFEQSRVHERRKESDSEKMNLCATQVSHRGHEPTVPLPDQMVVGREAKQRRSNGGRDFVYAQILVSKSARLTKYN